MQSLKIKIIQDVEPESIQVPDHYRYHSQVPRPQVPYHHQFNVRDLQKAVTEKYGIPGAHIKFQPENGNGYLDPILNYYSAHLIKVLVDKDFVMDKSLKKEAGTKVFIEDMTKLMDDPETADFTLKVGMKSFKVHKAILGARSGVFRTMFLAGMKEAVESEAVITDVSEEILQEVLHYLYTGELSRKDYGINPLCYAAIKYQLDTLMDLICQEIRKSVLQVEEVAEVFISAEMFGKEELFKVAMEKLRENKEMMDDSQFEEMLIKRPKLLYKIMKEK